jgi:hypothetical protein
VLEGSEDRNHIKRLLHRLVESEAGQIIVLLHVTAEVRGLCVNNLARPACPRTIDCRRIAI